MHFLFSLEIKKKEYDFSKEKKSFLVKLSLSFSMERRSRLLCYEKRMFLIFVVPFMTWVDKFGKWNNQFGSLGILEGNREALLFIIGIKALLGCFLPFIYLFILYFYVFQRKKNIIFFLKKKMNKEELFFFSSCGFRKTKINNNKKMDKYDSGYCSKLIIIIIIIIKKTMFQKQK